MIITASNDNQSYGTQHHTTATYNGTNIRHSLQNPAHANAHDDTRAVTDSTAAARQRHIEPTDAGTRQGREVPLQAAARYVTQGGNPSAQAAPPSSRAPPSNSWAGSRLPADAVNLQQRAATSYYPSWRYVTPATGVPQPPFQPSAPGYQTVPRHSVIPSPYGHAWVMPGVQTAAVYQTPHDTSTMPSAGAVPTRQYSTGGQLPTAARSASNTSTNVPPGYQEPEGRLVPKLVVKPSRKRTRSNEKQAKNGVFSEPESRPSRSRKTSDCADQNSSGSEVGSSQKRLFVRHVIQPPIGKQSAPEPARSQPTQATLSQPTTQAVGITATSPWPYQVAATPGMQYYPQSHVYVSPGYGMAHGLAATAINGGVPVQGPIASQQIYGVASLPTGATRHYAGGVPAAQIRQHSPSGYSETVPVPIPGYNPNAQAMQGIPAASVPPTALHGQEVRGNVGYIPQGFISGASNVTVPRPAPHFTYNSRGSNPPSQDYYMQQRVPYSEASSVRRPTSRSSDTAAPAELPVKIFSEPLKGRRSRSSSESRSRRQSSSSGGPNNLSTSDTCSSDTDHIPGKVSSDDDVGTYRGIVRRLNASRRKPISSLATAAASRSSGSAPQVDVSLSRDKGTVPEKGRAPWPAREEQNRNDVDSGHSSGPRAEESSSGAVPDGSGLTPSTVEGEETLQTATPESVPTIVSHPTGRVPNASAIETVRAPGFHRHGEWPFRPSQPLQNPMAFSIVGMSQQPAPQLPPPNNGQIQQGLFPGHQPNMSTAVSIQYGPRMPSGQSHMYNDVAGDGTCVSYTSVYPDVGSPPIVNRLNPSAMSTGWTTGSDGGGMTQSANVETIRSGSPQSVISLTCEWERLPTSSDELNPDSAECLPGVSKLPLRVRKHVSNYSHSTVPEDSELDDIDVTSTSPMSNELLREPSMPGKQSPLQFTAERYNHRAGLSAPLDEVGRLAGKDLMQPRLVLVKATRPVK